MVKKKSKRQRSNKANKTRSGKEEEKKQVKEEDEQVVDSKAIKRQLDHVSVQALFPEYADVLL